VRGKRVYAVDGDSDAVTRLGGKPVRVGYSPAAIAVRGTSAYVVNTIDSTVTVLNTSTGRPATTIATGSYTYPTAIVLAGATAIVVEPYGYSVSLIDTRTNRAYPPIGVGAYPVAAAVTG
jgi:DNA-binding beta-propeller fold protein YncE